MRTHRSVATAAALAVAAALALAGCQVVEPPGPAAPEEEPAVVELTEDGSPARIALSEAAAERLGITTTAVTALPQGSTVPYAAVVYDADGASWAFVELEPRTYRRAALTITGIAGDVVTLSAGPLAGTQVVTTGAPMLVGAEAGISGGE